MIDLSISADIKYLAQDRLKVRCLMLDDKVITDFVQYFSSKMGPPTNCAAIWWGEEEWRQPQRAK